MPASTVTHDYHLTMFPHKLFLLERNRWKMLLADLRGADAARALAAAGADRADDVGLLPAARAEVPEREGPAATAGSRANRAQIRERRGQVDSVRRRSDRGVLRGLRWGYPLDQFLTLGRERGESEGTASPRVATVAAAQHKSRRQAAAPKWGGLTVA